MRAALSNSISPSSSMRPRSGRSRPAIILIMLVLPAPEGPNKAVAPLSLVNDDVHREFAEMLFHLYDEHGHAPCRRAAARRASHSEASSAASR